MLHEGESQIGAASYQSETDEIQLPSSEQVKTPEVFVDPEATAAWFAGVLEVGAIAYISETTDVREGGRRIPKTLPGITIHTTSPKTIDVLYKEYGGSRSPRIWKKNGRVAAEIVASTEPFSVARKGHVRAMQRWLTAESIYEQVEIARELQNTRWQDNGDQEAYRETLRNPMILAGVLDCRAYVGRRKDRQLYIEVTSKNTALLYALKDIYKGSVRITDEKGSVIDRGTVAFETKADSYIWSATGKDAIGIIQEAASCLQATLPENWDYQRSVEVREEKAQEDDKILAYLREEMKLFKAGQIGRISTDDELTRKLSIGIQVLRRAYRSLPENEKTERRKLVSQLAGRKFDLIEAREKAAYIVQEVEEFQQGKRDSISVVADLVANFGVGEDVIKLHILPHLTPEVYRAWRSILNSQGARRREANKRAKRLGLTS